jgi:hypothetical protein
MYAQKDLVIDGVAIRRGDVAPIDLPKEKLENGIRLGHFAETPPVQIAVVGNPPSSAE